MGMAAAGDPGGARALVAAWCREPGSGTEPLVDQVCTPRPAHTAVELVTTSVTSDTLQERFIGSALFNLLPLGGFDHINVSDHGYFRSFVTVDEWRTEFVSVRSIAEPHAESFVDATCVIASGTARAEATSKCGARPTAAT